MSNTIEICAYFLVCMRAFFAFPPCPLLSLPLKYGIVLSLVPVIFCSSLQTWFPDPSFRLTLGPVASIKRPKDFAIPCVSLTHSFPSNFCPLFFPVTTQRQILCACSHISSASSVAPRLPAPLPLCLLSHFLFSTSAVFCDWQLKLDCKRVNGELGGEYLEDLQPSGDAQIR